MAADDPRVQALLHEASAALPEALRPDAAAFAEAVRLRTGTTGDPASLHAADLWLATAAAGGNAAAIEHIERTHRDAIDAALSQAPADVADEVRQRLRERLFVGRDGAPRIEAYLGRGPLRAWLRISARREWLDYRKSVERRVEREDVALHSVQEDGELMFLREHYRPEFQAAAAEAFASLSTRDRNMLRQHYVHGLKLGEVARLNKVHRATIHRWLADVRNALQVAMRQGLCDRLGVAEPELQSIVRIVQSRLDLPLEPLVRSRP